MPFLAPLIAGAIGVGIVGEMLIGAGLSLAMSYGARLLAPKPGSRNAAGYGHRLALRMDAAAEREVILGRAATAGSLVYYNISGDDGVRLEMIYALADHECDALESLYVNGNAVAWDAGTGDCSTVTSPPAGTPATYTGKLNVRFYRGTWGQTADPALVAHSAGRWTSDDRGRGVCYVVVTLLYDQAIFPSGVPRFLFIVRGARLYDWRADSTAGGSGAQRWADQSTWTWSDNPAVALYNWRRGIWINGTDGTAGGQRIAGMNTPAAALPIADWTAAANACDELVGLKGGGTEKRYRLGGVVATDTPHREVITDILTAMAGREIDTGGLVRPLPGIAQSSVMAMTDADLMADGEVTVTGKLPRSRLVNAVFGTFHEPTQQYQAIAAPPRISPTDEETDGDIRLERHYALDYVTSGTQAQRILEIMRRRGRAQMQVTGRLRSRFAVLEPGDWITWTSARHGWTSQPFEVASISAGQDLTVTVTLAEVSASIFGWTAADHELDPAAPSPVPTGGPSLSSIAGLALANVTITAADGAQRPGLRATWTAVTDKTVAEIVIQYRKSGDTTALERRVADPSTGQYTWLDGVQGGIVYEARAIPVTLPPRAVTWSSWTAVPTAGDSHVVDVAALALGVEPGSISDEELDAQTRFEIGLTTATDAVLGSAGATVMEAYGWAERAGEEALRALLHSNDVSARVTTTTRTLTSADQALAQQITVVAAGLATANASITTEQTARVAGDNALSSSLTTVSSTVAGHSTSIAAILTSVDGLEARWGVAINVDGQVTGLVQLDGTDNETTFTVVADKVQVAQPGVSGGAAVPVFTIGNVDGTPKLALRGDMLIDGSIAARAISVTSLSAIVANLGIITAGRIQNAANTTFFDLSSGEFQITAS